MRNLIVLTVIGFLAQLIDGLLGMGYGVSSAALLLTFGLAPALASASVHTAETATALFAGIAHWRQGNVRWNLFWPLALFGALGGVIGAACLVNLPVKVMTPIVATLLLLSGLRILLRYLRNQQVTVAAGEHSSYFLGGLGFVGGAVDAIGGGGWGAVCTGTLVSSDKHEPRYVIGSVNASEFFVTIAIAITFAVCIGLNQFLWEVVLCLMAGGLAAAPLSAWLVKKVSPRKLGVLVGLALIVLNLRVLVMVLF